MSGQKPREIAVRVLQGRDAGDFVENRLELALAQTPLSSVDRHLCQELVYGIVRWRLALDWLIVRKTSGRTQKPMLQTLLQLGLYQIFWLDRIPGHAAVHETVELAKQHGFGPQAGFINAVLRGYLRELDATRALLADLKTSQPSIGFSHPQWLVERWQRRWGVERAAQLMDWNNTRPRTFGRINMLKTDATKLLAQWRDENVDYDFPRHDWIEENTVFELKSIPPLTRLSSFQSGWFYVQDPSTLLAVRELDPQPEETILDFCAAPGGKLTYIAQAMRNEGRLVGHEVSPERLKLIEENCARLGVTCVQPVLPAEFANQRFPPFDRVLLDVPCSNTGTMRRRVDLRWRIRPEEIARLHASQLGLLRQAVALLKSGGILVYSTCSLEPEENREVVAEFLREYPNIKLQRDRELLPFAEGVDGAYVARLMKN